MTYDEHYDYDLDNYEYLQEMMLTIDDDGYANPFVLPVAEKLEPASPA